MKVLALIPARGGSKGVPRKNIRQIGGKPLIAYSIQAAQAVQDRLHRIVVSTEDLEIAAVAREYGADVPFMRPAELASDRAKMVPVIQHAVTALEQQDDVRLDWVLLLQPTAIFRRSVDIQQALELTATTDADSIISVVQVFSEHPILMKRIENQRLLPYCIEEQEGTRRQDYDPPAYMRNGAIYLTRRDVIMMQGSVWGQSISPYVMPAEYSINIDSELDLKLAEMMIHVSDEETV
jgi:CMP-N,N'-diacetyllegionaminic acid synthase